MTSVHLFFQSACSVFTMASCFSFSPNIHFQNFIFKHVLFVFFGLGFCQPRWDLDAYLSPLRCFLCSLSFLFELVVVAAAVVLCRRSSVLPPVHLGQIPHVSLSANKPETQDAALQNAQNMVWSNSTDGVPMTFFTPKLSQTHVHLLQHFNF